VRQVDLVCRYGGEEFIVLLAATEPGQARIIAERLCQGISQIKLELPDQELRFTVSIGVAELKGDMDGDTLVKAADAAMYRAKLAGKNRVCGP